jgi:hypothetical protein
MAEIVTLLQNVAQVVRRAPEPTLVHAYLRAARKFCLESRWLRRTVVIGIDAGADSLALAFDDTGDTALLEIIGVRKIDAYTAAAVETTWPLTPAAPTDWRPNQGAAQPRRYAYQPEGDIVLPSITDAAYELRIVLQAQPQLGVEELPDDLLRRWDRALDDGALAYLLGLGGQAWTNPVAARQHAIAFQAAINNARADEQRSYNTGTVMARMRRLF